MERFEGNAYWWTPCLIAIVIVQMLILFCITQIHRWAHRQTISQIYKEAVTNDPPVGFPIERLGTSVASEISSPSRPILVIVFGGCEGCGESVVREWAKLLSWQTWQKELTVILVFREQAEKVREVAMKGGWQVKAVADESSQIARTLNAFFVPRAYSFVDGKLVWLQKEPKQSVVETLESFLKAVKGEDAARKVMDAWVHEMREKAWGKEMAELAKGRRQR